MTASLNVNRSTDRGFPGELMGVFTGVLKIVLTRILTRVFTGVLTIVLPRMLAGVLTRVLARTLIAILTGIHRQINNLIRTFGNCTISLPINLTFLWVEFSDRCSINLQRLPSQNL